MALGIQKLHGGNNIVILRMSEGFLSILTYFVAWFMERATFI